MRLLRAGIFFLGLALTLALACNTQAAPYDIDHDNSTVSFTGTHAGIPFKGTFKEWSADIDFDPQQLDQSSLIATFHMASVSTGNPMYDGTLPQKDWFDSKDFPEAVFRSTSITHKENNIYHVIGNLTLRDITRPVTFDFTLSDITASPVKVHASFPVDRLAFDIGKKSDDKEEWVSREIIFTIDLSATAEQD